MARLLERIQQASYQPMDLQFLNFICIHELTLIQSLAEQVSIPQDVITALSTLRALLSTKLNNRAVEPIGREVTMGRMGHVKFTIDKDILQDLVDKGHSIPTISTIMGVSISTIKRALREYTISIRQIYIALYLTKNWTFLFTSSKEVCPILDLGC